MKIKNVCIVGGGTTGWMMAVALNVNMPNLKVTLVESEEIPSIGVGEATIPLTAKFISSVLKFDEKEWMAASDATYKTAIRFNNFSKIDESFWHPFWSDDEIHYNTYDWLIKRQIEDLPTEDFYKSNFIAWYMSMDKRFQEIKGFQHAHHMDANKFARYCQTQFKGTHINATVSSVEEKDGYIKSITVDGKEIKSDLFIDCTGFNALLIGETLNEPYTSYEDTLLNDSALVCRIPYGNDPFTNRQQECHPFTDCTALSSGWVFNTPVWSRTGTGYVYSSKFQSREDAEQEFRIYLVDRFGGDRGDIAEFRHISFKTGKYERSWVNNCLALTLASGFIEPLESTGLALACWQIENFIDVLKDDDMSSFIRATYNDKVNMAYDEIHTFIAMHYANTKREDTEYWKHIKNNLHITQKMVDYAKNDNVPDIWFPKKSRECVLIGLDIPSEYSKQHITWHGENFESIMKSDDNEKEFMTAGVQYLNGRKNMYQSISNDMPWHEDYLKEHIHVESEDS